METLLLILLFPLAWPFIAKRIWQTDITWGEMGLQVGVCVLVTSITWALGSWSATSDTEAWNGVITKKERIHDTYEESYSCNCTPTKGGGETCQTCYRTHYTVDWNGYTTVGNFSFASKDSTWRSVYNSSDPATYKAAFKGEPATIMHRYTNWVQAAPDTLFKNDTAVVKQYAKAVPSQPRTYGHYKYNRVLNHGGFDPTQAKLLDESLDNALIQMGKTKQVNMIVLFTDITDPMYQFAVENLWKGGEKNDVTLMIGLEADKSLSWVRVMTWALNSGNEVLQVKLEREIKNLPTLDAMTIGQAFIHTVDQYYVRPKMKDYEYLEDSIEPPLWALIMSILFAIGGSLVLTYVFVVYDFSHKHGNFTITKKRNRR